MGCYFSYLLPRQDGGTSQREVVSVQICHAVESVNELNLQLLFDLQEGPKREAVRVRLPLRPHLPRADALQDPRAPRHRQAAGQEGHTGQESDTFTAGATRSDKRFCYKFSHEFHCPIGHNTAVFQPGREENAPETSEMK